MRSLSLAFASFALAACSNSTPGVILKITGEAPASFVQVRIFDVASRTVTLPTGYIPVQTVDGTAIDITQTPLTVAVELSRPADIKLLLIGAIGAQPTGDLPAPEDQMFFAMRANLTGAQTIEARLLLVGTDDTDRDAFPSAATWPGHNAAASQLYFNRMELLDCDDDLDFSAIVGRTASSINPFASEKCTDGIDEDCDGLIAPCVDGDQDGDPAGSDCDDNNPARHHPTASDPFPDPANCCGYSLGKMKADPDYNNSFAGQPICPSTRCGDGIDEACKGSDTACIVDADCDGSPACGSPGAQAPPNCDCNDADETVHPGAPEPCGSTVDLNCSGVIGDGCVACDIDGDGYQRMDAAQGCPDAKDPHPGMLDCNDFDSGVHPGQTSEVGGSGAEGGNPANSVTMITSALRGNCRRYYDVTGTYPKISVGTAKAGDADCNGTAYENCPSMPCDADGDGFQNAGCSPPPQLQDCNDSDPTIFPGAPDKCGDTIAQNCVTDVACAGLTDADGDGYDVNNGDCDDNDRNVHPWAQEVCDGKDNDCDGLIDEGNPTTGGAALTTGANITSCTSDNDGECGKVSGLCVCSAASTDSSYDPSLSNRVVCPTEIQGSNGSPKTPQCYFSGQPSQDTCDGLDNQCVGSLAADGSGQCVGNQKCCNKTNPPNASTGYQCIDVVNGDANNCTSCNMQCNPIYANACVSSTCVCGATGAACQANVQWCSGGSCVACNTDAHCASAGCNACTSAQYCDAGSVCQNKKANSVACTGNNQCTSGVCTQTADGAQVCCNSVCTGQCTTCASGTCGGLAQFTDSPGNVGAGIPACNGSNTCNGMGLCRSKLGQVCGGGAACASGNCQDSTCCTSSACPACLNCDASGTCSTQVKNTTDTTGTTCTGTNSCDAAGACKKIDGTACTVDGECVSGHCVADGTLTGKVCCATSCATTCKYCNASFSSCSLDYPSSAQSPGCNGANSCDGSGNCM